MYNVDARVSLTYVSDSYELYILENRFYNIKLIGIYVNKYI